MNLIDHTNPIWASKMRRINGAYTYSQDLVKYQVPHWEKVLGENDLISTCPKIYERDVIDNCGTIIQYLHSYPYERPVEKIQAVVDELSLKCNRIVFVSGYKEYVRRLTYNGINAVYAPMSIDVKAVQEFEQPKIHSNRIIYFGNVVREKVSLFNKLHQSCKEAGLEFDYISTGRMNAKIEMTREEVLQTISTYKYGIGVGRCAQEMMALGVKVIIAGQRFGGLIVTEEDYERQLATNMNGRVHTHSLSLRKCLKNIDNAITQSNDITEVNHAELLVENLSNVFQ